MLAGRDGCSFRLSAKPSVQGRALRELIAAITEVYPELPILQGEEVPGDRAFRMPPVAWFGNDDILLMLIFDKGGLVLAEPELCWDHPNIPTWDALPKFPIPEAWLQSMTAEQRETLKTQAHDIGESRLAKYGHCVL